MILAISPGTALLAGTLVLLVVALAFWPDKGLYNRWIKSNLHSKRILLEDALKFIFDCDYKNKPCTLDSIAGNMHISADRATRIMDHLQSIGLVEVDDDRFHLTQAGRSYALQIIRVHRVWERYLADETGISHMEWHGAADSMEHQMSAEETDQLAASIGNPVFDPHGDPIPSSTGEIPDLSGKPLSQLKAGDIGRIVHIEDEPKVIYEQLHALDLYPGTQVYVMDTSDGKVQFAANGEECVLTQLFANNITVELLPGQEPILDKYETLTTLDIGEEAEIVGISAKCRGQERRRLLDFGVIPGCVVRAELRSASGDPTAYDIMGATIAIRKGLTDNIFITRKEKNNES